MMPRPMPSTGCSHSTNGGIALPACRAAWARTDEHEAAEEMRTALGELSVEEKRAIELGCFAAPTSQAIAPRTDAFVDTVKED